MPEWNNAGQLSISQLSVILPGQRAPGQRRQLYSWSGSLIPVLRRNAAAFEALSALVGVILDLTAGNVIQVETRK